MQFSPLKSDEQSKTFSLHVVRFTVKYDLQRKAKGIKNYKLPVLKIVAGM